MRFINIIKINKVNLIFYVLVLNIFSMIIPMKQDHKAQDIISTNIDGFNKENCLINLPDELLINIITEVIQSHINKWNDISEFDNEEFKKDLYSMILICKRFNNLDVDIIKIAKKLKKMKFEYLKTNIKNRYKKYLSEIELNKKLNRLLNIALRYDVKEDLKECVRLIIAGADINTKNKRGETTLIVAAMNMHYRIKIVELLIYIGANINDKGKYGSTALMYASRYGHIKIAGLLIDSGADVNAVNTYGNTALMLATLSGCIEIVKLLIDKGANINAKNVDGETALMLATRYSYVKIVRLLIDMGTNINTKNNNGDTALMLAMQREQDYRNRKADIVKLLEPKKDCNISCVLS